MKDRLNEKMVRTKTELARVRAAKLQGVATSLEIMGSGPLNRDGHPQLPPDQQAVKTWPILDLGIHPEVTRADWRLSVTGLVERPQTLSWDDLLQLPQVEDTSDFHCVTGWSRLGLHWKGVRFQDLAQQVGVKSEARFVYTTAYDGYSTNLPLDEALKYDVLLVYEAEGEPLPREHGGPVRMITPQLWAWKGAKWIQGIEFRREDQRGFWELRGYSNSAVPWLNDRYTADEVSE
jgi:DMSO/TMAO reductase YedYZ molybdopterin-dependent catalytic subunit